jgi:acetoin utilization deacetylase AcuC-like enzyme
MQTNIIYSERYNLNIGQHVFPTVKYNLIKKRLAESEDLKDRILFIEAEPASLDDLLLVHTEGYLDKLLNGTLSIEEIYRLELPYSKEIVDGSILCCGGTIACSAVALEKRMAIHLGGGFHHAFPDHGEGFCVLNDVAVAIKKLKRDGKIERALIIDCDLHQGNGTAFIFSKDRDVFTFSIHQQNNYPSFKPKSDLDIGLEDGTGDEEYLAQLRENIPPVIDKFRPEVIIYLAGADPYQDDQIGGLGLAVEGLKQRDEFIYTQALNQRIPLAIVLAGGYARRLEDTVKIHFNTVAGAIKMFGS